MNANAPQHATTPLVIAAWATLWAASFGQTIGKEPASLVVLREAYEQAVEQEQIPLKEIYQQELVKLKEAYSQAGDLESALAADAAIKGETSTRKVPSLIRLKDNYDNAVARKVGALRLAHGQELTKLKTDLTKSGDLQAALAVDTALKALESSSPPAVSAPAVTSASNAGKIQPLLALSPAKILASEMSKDKFAGVTVENGTWGVLTSGADCYAGSNRYQWKDVPPELENIRFSLTPNGKGETPFTVDRSGRDFLATSTRWKSGGGGGGGPDALDQKGLEKKGWRHLSEFDKLANTDTGNWMVFYKQCAAGETHSIRTEKYAAPILLTR